MGADLVHGSTFPLDPRARTRRHSVISGRFLLSLGLRPSSGKAAGQEARPPGPFFILLAPVLRTSAHCCPVDPNIEKQVSSRGYGARVHGSDAVTHPRTVDVE